MIGNNWDKFLKEEYEKELEKRIKEVKKEYNIKD